MANQQKGKKPSLEKNQDKKTPDEEKVIDIESSKETQSDSSNDIKIETTTVIEDKKFVEPDTLKAKEASSSAAPSEKKKSSIFGLIWPVITGVAAAGGVIASQNIWLKNDNSNANDVENIMAGFEQSLSDQRQNIDQLHVNMDALKQQAQENTNLVTDEDITKLQQVLNDQTSQIQVLEQTFENQQSAYAALEKQYQQLQTAWQDLNSQYGKINAQLEGSISQIQALSTSLDDGTTPEITNQLAALEASRRQSVQALQAQIANLTNALDNVQSQQPAFEIFDKRVNQLENDVVSLQGNINDINQKVGQDLEQLSSDVQQAANVNNLLLQFDKLQQAVLSGDSYDIALNEFAKQAKIDLSEDIYATLQQNKQGIARFSVLKSRFNDLARSLVVTARKAEAAASDNKTKSLLSNFNELVTVTRNDGGEQGSIDRLIYDVKQALDAEDLKQVQTLFTSAQPEVQTEAKDWLQDVQNRQNTLDALQQLKLKLLGSA